MKRIFPKRKEYLWCLIIGVFCASLCFAPLQAQNWTESGDTMTVQTITWDDPSPIGFSAPYRKSFIFPDGSESYRKVLMYYTLKCDPRTAQDNFDCGEWDYTTHTFITNYAGKMDSTFLSQPNFTVDGATPESFSYSTNPVWHYVQDEQIKMTVRDAITLQTATFGQDHLLVNDFDSQQPIAGAHNNFKQMTLGGAKAKAKAQFVWTAEELIERGLKAGNITAITLPVEQIGSELKHLSIELKHSETATTDYVSNGAAYETGNFTEVYRLNTTLSEGEHTFYFHTPFNWDGVNNVVVQVVYDNQNEGIDNLLKADYSGIGALTQGRNGYLDFKGPDYVEVPTEMFSQISDEITISFWQYGDPTTQPQSDYAFEGRDANGNRVVNVHLPWGNSQVYWDAGNSGTGSYDRINQTANFEDFAGKWNHWAFTKNVATGEMHMYLNGELWLSGTGRSRTFSPMTTFRIGAPANANPTANQSYDGALDDFRIWNKALDGETIKAWMHKDIAMDEHPAKDNLLAYYKFDEQHGVAITDATNNSHTATLVGFPSRRQTRAKDLARNFVALDFRPAITFRQEIYQAKQALQIAIDSFQNDQVNLVLYETTAPATIISEEQIAAVQTPTSTQLVWETGAYSYIYDWNGQIVDSVLIAPEQTLERRDHEFYSAEVTYEIGRFITPYGIGLDLGDEGFRWVFDVTDYAPILQDSIFIQAGNNQELLDLKFIMIKGTPARDVVGIKNLWRGNPSYASLIDDTNGEPITITLPEKAASFRVKTRASGHGFGNNQENCAEFCRKTHSLSITGDQSHTFNWDVWNECAFNPVYPQGGTWVYDRAGWCPGDIVSTFDHELTPYVKAGETITLDYGIEGTTVGAAGNYVLQSQLISYGNYNFDLDAELEDVIAPSKTDYHSRRNPICGGPIVKIKNNGKTNLTSLLITYGIKDFTGGYNFPCYYRWEGNLALGESEEVQLPTFNWYLLDEENPEFKASISEPNGGADEYEVNNEMKTSFELPPRYGSGLALEIRTNNAAFENSYTITNDLGEVVYSRSNFSPNTGYSDVLELANGCYTLLFKDEGVNGNDGIAWWANNDGNGSVRLRKPGRTGASPDNFYLTFDPDFGGSIEHHFTIGHTLGAEFFGIPCSPEGKFASELPESQRKTAEQALKSMISIYPNPAIDEVFVDVAFGEAKQVKVEVFNTVGQLISTIEKSEVQQDQFAISLPNVGGIYYVKVTTNQGDYTKPIMVSGE